MNRRIDFSGRFEPAARRMLTPGSSYIGFRCRSCGQHFALMDDIPGPGDLKLGGSAQFDMQCPMCGARAAYGVGDLATFIAAQGGAASTS